ncbi:hypothetical protein MKX83_17145 [Cytobacillus sp. FSL M8-0252]|uniref:hypothetical protein n=1 Tax=Cytobacillus sp. FSL M8-0252 TaxID=2921621 RepID=UPI0030F9DFE6
MRVKENGEKGYALVTVLLIILLIFIIIPPLLLGVLQSTKQITQSQFDIQHHRLIEVGVTLFSTQEGNKAIALSDHHCVVFATDTSWVEIGDETSACTCDNALDIEGLGIIPIYKNKCGAAMAFVHEGEEK